MPMIAVAVCTECGQQEGSAPIRDKEPSDIMTPWLWLVHLREQHKERCTGKPEEKSNLILPAGVATPDGIVTP